MTVVDEVDLTALPIGAVVTAIFEKNGRLESMVMVAPGPLAYLQNPEKVADDQAMMVIVGADKQLRNSTVAVPRVLNLKNPWSSPAFTGSETEDAQPLFSIDVRHDDKPLPHMDLNQIQHGCILVETESTRYRFYPCVTLKRDGEKERLPLYMLTDPDIGPKRVRARWPVTIGEPMRFFGEKPTKKVLTYNLHP